MKRTKTQRLVRALQTGRDFTTSQITNQFGIVNVHNAIQQLRLQGYPIYSDRTVFGNGSEATVYKIGRPTRAIVAAGYALLGARESGLANA